MNDTLGDQAPMELYQDCRLCPRQCGADRTAGELGFCGQSSRLFAARAALHYWEEPCISGERPGGSGTVFFSGCTLRCVYCQNAAISRGEAGRELSARRLADIFLALEQKGAVNINLVTPTHCLPHLLEAIPAARRRGLSVPIVYNTSGYERPETLRLLEGLVQVWLPDFKYKSSELSELYSFALDYPDWALAALDEMVRQAGPSRFDGRGLMTRGVLVRHLILPGRADDSRAVVRLLWERYGDSIWMSLMNQYTPMPDAAERFPELARRLSPEEYDAVVDFAAELGVEQAFVQEEGTAKDSFIPPFNYEGL